MSTLGSVILKGIAASIPSAGIPGRVYFATDTDVVYRDNGTTWDSVITGGGGGGGGSSVEINGGSALTTANFNATTPSAPGGTQNVAFQVDGSGNISANVPTGGSSKMAQFVLSSPAASITFSSIPGTFTDLYVIINGQSSSGSQDDILVQINGDTGGDYNFTFMYATSAIAASTSNAQDHILVGVINPSSDTNVSASCEIDFDNYSGSTFFKTVGFVSNYLDSSGDQGILTGSGNWTATPAAITSIKLYLNSGGNFTTGTTATLYGR